MIAYSDSDWNNDINNRISVTGFVITLCGVPVKWSSRKQTCVTLSSTDAEYFASMETGRFVRAFRHLLVDLGFHLDGPTTIRIDNQSAIKRALQSPFQESSRNRHIDNCHHWICQYVEAGKMDLEYIPTADQMADLLTKVLPFPKMSEHRDALHIIQLSR
jgi:hypothetical protein